MGHQLYYLLCNEHLSLIKFSQGEIILPCVLYVPNAPLSLPPFTPKSGGGK